MAKTVDVPTELREFNTVFDSVAGYKWDDAKVFHDLCDYIIACLLIDGDKDCAERLEKEYKDEYPKFKEMFRELLLAHDKVLNRKEWYDGLGTFYEVIKSSSKSSALGQYFTPESLVDCMVQIQLGEDLPKGKTINDPASGSGRFLIAFHANAPGNFQYGCDIDTICAKMTAINMCLSGCVGQAVCGDALQLIDSFRFGYDINPLLTFHKMPGIKIIEKEASFEYRIARNANSIKAEPKEPEKEPEVKVKIPKGDFVAPAVEIVMEKSGQFSMF